MPFLNTVVFLTERTLCWICNLSMMFIPRNLVFDWSASTWYEIKSGLIRLTKKMKAIKLLQLVNK
jgi:hypothetical protein